MRASLSLRSLIILALFAGISAASAQTPGSKSAAPATAIFAGGCFWCVEEAFEKVPGVISAVSGYTGGSVPNPSYELVSSHKTGHAESVRVTFDPAKVSYSQLVDWFWHNIDPTQTNGQFCDHGSPYRTAIFYATDEQKQIAEQSKKALEASGVLKAPIVTEITPAGPFYEAEDYHQDYYKKNPHRYSFYKHGCGRAQRLEQIWGKPTAPPGGATH
jgi:peptide-methionine (S)-S-oxide reductase